MMNKHIFKIFKFLTILVTIFYLLTPTSAQADIMESLGDFANGAHDSLVKLGKNIFNVVKDAPKAAVDAAGQLAAEALGIDTDIHCSEPVRHHTCLFCPMFHIFFNASSSVARASYGAFHDNLGKLILIFLAVSLALIILKNVASMGARDPGTLMNELMTKAFVCVVIYLIITQDYFNVLNNTLAPILSDGLNLVNNIVGKSDSEFIYGNSYVVNHRGTPMGYNTYMGGLESTLPSTASGTYVEGSLNGAVMPISIDYMIVHTINQIEQKIFLLFEYGEWAFCRGMGPDRIFYILPHPVFLVDGLFLYLGGLFYMVAYPWILADAVLQLGISMALLPFAIAGFAFNGTKKYLPKVFNWILHSIFVFIFMAILINVVLGYVGNLLTKLFFYAGDPVQFFLNPVKGIAFYGANMIKVVFILAIGWIYMPLVRDLAGNFAKGTSLTPAAKVGDVAKDSVERVSKKVGNYTAQVVGKSAAGFGNSTARRFRSINRHLALGLAQRFGKNRNNNKEFSVAGVKFISETDAATGKSILRREFTSITGRRHVTISDKVCTIKEEYDRKGNLIKRTVRFKYGSLRKLLVDKDGKVDLETLNFVFGSRIGRNYRQAIMEQVAVDALKAKGKNIGTYYNSRHVIYDPATPTKITIEQIDHSGKVTRFGLNVNPVTGQTATSYVQDVTKTDPIHRTERKTRVWMHKMFIRRFGHIMYEHGATIPSFDTFWGTHYEMRRDPVTQELYYVRVRRRYWFFGPSVEKTFFANRTQTRVLKSVRRQARDNEKMAKIVRKLNRRSHTKGFWYTYDMHTDGHGTIIYSRRLRAGWNVKNYARLGIATSKVLLKMPVYALKISTYPLIHPTKTVRGIFHPVTSYRSMASSLKTEFSGIYKGSWQTGNIKNYSVDGATVVNSTTGQTAKTSFNDQTTIKNIDGSRVVKDNVSGETVNYYNKRTIRREVFLDNGVVKVETKSKHSSDGSLVDEKTKFQYSPLAQQGHDSILSPANDDHQVVKGDGTIAKDLRSIISGRPNPLDLTFGFDNIAGMTAVGSKNISDFMVNDIFAEGRKRRTNKMRTNFSSFLH